MLHIFIVSYFIIRVIGSNPNIRTQHNGITWSLAATDCGDNGLEIDETVIVRSNFPVNHTFWIGIATINIETDWIELGCYTIHPIDTDIFVPYNLTSCKNICRSEEYLAHKRLEKAFPPEGWRPSEANNPKENKCACLKYSIQIVRPSLCESPNSFHVYKDDMHSPLSCLTGMIDYHFGYLALVRGRRDCNNPLDWYLCKSSEKHISATNANKMSFSKHMLTTKRQNGSLNRPSHKSLVDVFNSVSQTTAIIHTETTEKKKVKEHHEINRFPFGAIFGGGSSVVVVIVLILVLVVCKIRSCGIFKALKIEQHDVFSSNATTDDSNIPADINSVITSNQTYGIANSCESNSNTYATVNKLRNTCLKANDETYTDSSYGEYDRLNDVQKRKILTTENLYDINEGTRNKNDPTYNSADLGRRKTDHHESDMNMYSIMSANSGDYTLNST